MSDVLEVKLAGLDKDYFKKFVDLLFYTKGIKYEFVQKFSRAGLVFGAGELLPISEVLLGCIHIQITEKMDETIRLVQTIIDTSYTAEMQNLQSRKSFLELEKSAENIYKNSVWPLIDEKIELSRKMLRDQRANPLNEELLKVVEKYEKMGGFHSAIRLLDEVITRLLNFDQTLKKEDLCRWNNGFVFVPDLTSDALNRMELINSLCGKGV